MGVFCFYIFLICHACQHSNDAVVVVPAVILTQIVPVVVVSAVILTQIVPFWITFFFSSVWIPTGELQSLRFDSFT